MGANTTRGFLAGLALAGALAAGCGGKPFPDPLQSLDELTRGPVALQIDVDLEQFEDDARVLDYRTRALDMYRASLVYHEYAVDAHKKNNGDKAELLARVGLIYFSGELLPLG